MNYYFFIITLIDVFALLIMCVLTKGNNILDKQQKKWFVMSFILIALISIFEVISIAVDNKESSLRWVNIIANYLGFGLSPAASIFLAIAVDKKANKIPLYLEGLFLAFLAISFPFKLIFFVDQNNHYMRGELFLIYVIAYIISILYLLIETINFIKSYQNKSKNSIYIIAAFLLLCTTIQVIFPEIHVTWFCISLLSILFFIYCNGMWQEVDKLTGLLNQNSYLNETASLSRNIYLIVFDVDNFKQVNDTYGHLRGDKYLEIIAECIKKAYSHSGLCYRIGGDEFCVLLDAKANEEKCYENLVQALEKKREELGFIPSLSAGSAEFTVGDSILSVKETADQRMYYTKKVKKLTNFEKE